MRVLALLSMAAYTYAAVAIYPYEPKPAEFGRRLVGALVPVPPRLFVARDYHPSLSHSAGWKGTGAHLARQRVAVASQASPAADQDGCYIADLNMVLPYNKPYYPKKDKTCLQYTCGTNNETQLFSCGAVGLPPNCHLEYDYILDYPKCCGSPVCDPTTTTQTPTTEPVCITVTPEPVTVTTESCVTVTTEKTCGKTAKPIPIEDPSTEPNCGLPRPQKPRPPIPPKVPKKTILKNC